MSTEALLALGKMRKVHVFEYGGQTLHFRGLSHKDRSEWRAFAMDEQHAAGSDNLMIAMALCKADGAALFDTPEARDEAMTAIAEWDPVEICKPLIDKILLASGIAKAAEDGAAKN